MNVFRVLKRFHVVRALARFDVLRTLERFHWLSVSALFVPPALFTMALAPLPTQAADTPSPYCVARTTPVPKGQPTLVSETIVAGHDNRLLDVVLFSPALQSNTH